MPTSVDTTEESEEVVRAMGHLYNAGLFCCVTLWGINVKVDASDGYNAINILRSSHKAQIWNRAVRDTQSMVGPCFCTKKSMGLPESEDFTLSTI